MPKRPEALVAIPTEESIPFDPDLLDAAEPESLADEDAVLEPTAVEHLPPPPPPRQEQPKELTPRSGERSNWLTRVYDVIGQAKELNEKSSWKETRDLIVRAGTGVDKLERELKALTEEIEQKKIRLQNVDRLLKKRDEANDAIYKLKEVRRDLNKLLQVIPSNPGENKESDLEQGEAREIDAVPLKELQKRYLELSGLAKTQKIDELQHEKQLLEKKRNLSEKERKEREEALARINEILAGFDVDEEVEEPSPSSEIPASGERFINPELHEKLQKAADAVRKEYGKDPEEILKNPLPRAFQITKNAALALMGHKEDPMEVWKELDKKSKETALPINNENKAA